MSFLDLVPNIREKIGKADKLNLIHLRSFDSENDLVKRIQRQTTYRENTLGHILNKALAFRI